MDEPEDLLEGDIELVAGGIDEDDLSDINAAAFRSLTVIPTDWTVEVLSNQIAKGRIELSPTFQRRVAWSEAKMSKFIESLFLRLPVPQIVLAEVKPGRFIVIDGKQRLTALARFVGVIGQKLRLQGCEYLADLNDKTIDDLKLDAGLSAALDAFESHTIRTVILQKWNSEDLLYLLFLRLNQNSVTLSPQELRRALHPGPFLDWLDGWTADCEELRAIFPVIPDFRMRDMEVVTRYLGFAMFADSYAGNMKKFLDHTTKEINAGWPRSQQNVEFCLDELKASLAATRRIFGSHAFKTFVDGRYQRTPNRAVIDIMTYALSSKVAEDAALKNADAVRELFEGLCMDNARFIRYLQSTTKSRDATYGRFSIWCTELSELLSVHIKMPPLPGP